MNFDRFVEEGLISMATRDWIRPLWRQEEEDLERVREARQQNCLFHDDKEELPDANGFSIHDVMETTSLTILETKITYHQDNNSSGHGNRVWAAAVATCFFLKDFHNRTSLRLRSIELGAGTAVPSLYLAHLLAERENHPMGTPSSCVHITDAKRYRNIRQILASVKQQPETVRQKVRFRVSPHDWGVGVGVDDDRSFLNSECCFDEQQSNHSGYDLVVVSDCIYNFQYHSKLLYSIAATLALPMDQHEEKPTTASESKGGCAIVSFSLHGNTNDSAVWEFFDMANRVCSLDGKWRLQSEPVSSLSHCLGASGIGDSIAFNMEATMKDLGIWISHLEPRRWNVYLYTLRWVPRLPE